MCNKEHLPRVSQTCLLALPSVAAAAKLELLSEECYEEVLQAKIKRGKSVENNPALGE